MSQFGVASQPLSPSNQMMNPAAAGSNYNSSEVHSIPKKMNNHNINIKQMSNLNNAQKHKHNSATAAAMGDQQLMKNIKDLQSMKIYDINDIQRQLEVLTEDGKNITFPIRL